MGSDMRRAAAPPPLRLRVGDLVEVRSREEILATLTPDGTLDELPFMPEMLAFCGRRFAVDKRADKTCDTIKWTGLRRLVNTVHLAGTRCTGAAHGGCEAACQIFWNEAWLRRVLTLDAPAAGSIERTAIAGVPEAALHAATRQLATSAEGEILYRCQATDLLKFTSPLPSSDLRQYYRDVRSGNTTVGTTMKGIAWWLFKWSQANLRGHRLQNMLFNHMQRIRGGMANISLAGDKKKTPLLQLGLARGDRVQVRSAEEIRDTLNVEQRNRGLYFDKEMTPFCGGSYTVGSRVTQIIEETTGRMMKLPGDCLILEGVHCTGKYHKNCPRASPSYWREIWLRRIDGDSSGGAR